MRHGINVMWGYESDLKTRTAVVTIYERRGKRHPRESPLHLHLAQPTSLPRRYRHMEVRLTVAQKAEFLSALEIAIGWIEQGNGPGLPVQPNHREA